MFVYAVGINETGVQPFVFWICGIVIFGLAAQRTTLSSTN